MNGFICIIAMQVKQRAHQKMDFMRNHVRTKVIGPNVPIKLNENAVYCIAQWSSYIGRRADALALRADERRDKLRKAVGSGKYMLIHRYLNGATY